MPIQELVTGSWILAKTAPPGDIRRAGFVFFLLPGPPEDHPTVRPAGPALGYAVAVMAAAFEHPRNGPFHSGVGAGLIVFWAFMRTVEMIPPLRERVESSFRESQYTAIRDICCDDHEGTLLIRGRLPSHYLKQLVLAAACEIAGTIPIRVEIVVDGSRWGDGSPRSPEFESVATFG